MTKRSIKNLPSGVKIIENIIKTAKINPAKARKQLHQELHVDKETGLLSRRGLQTLLEDIGNSPTTSGILYIDLMGLKKINDTLGHEAGDKAIASVAAALKKIIRSKRTKDREPDSVYLFLDNEVGRMGGDEFVVVLKNVKGHEGVIAASKRITNHFNDKNISPIAIGCSLYTKGKDIKEVIEQADQAMYKIKKDIYKRKKKESDYAVFFKEKDIKLHPD